MSEETPIVRQWLLLRMLAARHHGATVKEMVDETGVSEKTIRRDLELFQQVGFPVVESLEELNALQAAYAANAPGADGRRVDSARPRPKAGRRRRASLK